MNDSDRTEAYQPTKVDKDSAEMPHCIGRYRVERILGKGGFGVVFLAYDDVLQRLVAIKGPNAISSCGRKTRRPIFTKPAS